MQPSSEAKRPSTSADTAADRMETTLERMETALAKCTQLMERHLAAGEITVPARALYFILRDAGYGMTQPEAQELKQTAKQRHEPTNQLHHNYGMRR